MANRTPHDLHLFRNYQSPQDMLGVGDFDHPELHTHRDASAQLVWKAAKATGAAPSFFRPEGKYVDGGILSNNPALDLLTEVAEHNAALKAVDRSDEVATPTVLVTMGTGTPPVKKVIATEPSMTGILGCLPPT